MYKGDRDWFSIVAISVVAFVFAIVIGSFVVGGIFAVKTVKSINDRGLKNVIERVWEGPR